MSRYVLDASVALAWLLPDERGSDELMAAARDGEATAPGVWPLEVLNTLRIVERRGRLTPALVDETLEDLRAFPIEVVPFSNLAEVLALARTHDLTVHDAAYLDLAKGLELPLATLDRALAAAAESEGVELLPV